MAFLVVLVISVLPCACELSLLPIEVAALLHLLVDVVAKAVQTVKQRLFGAAVERLGASLIADRRSKSHDANVRSGTALMSATSRTTMGVPNAIAASVERKDARQR